MFVTNGEYEIFYDTFGNPTGSPFLFINGFTTHCVSWPPELIEGLVANNFFVIVFDNRDVGLTTKSAQGQNYTVHDMASDAVAVLDALGVAKAQVWGQSMGGMIVQQMAIDFPDRLSSMCSVMSTTGAPGVGGATDEAIAMLLTPAPEGREANIEHNVQSGRLLAGPCVDDDFERWKHTQQYDRCYWPQGSAHQMTALRKAQDRTVALQQLAIPTTVIHGRADPLIQFSGGEATAAAIPGARFVDLPDMGHTLPSKYYNLYVDEMVALRARISPR